MKIDPDDPSYPNAHYVSPNGDFIAGQAGMTIRAKIAAMAMQSLARNDPRVNEWPGAIAAEACRLADALISELNK